MLKMYEVNLVDFSPINIEVINIEYSNISIDWRVQQKIGPSMRYYIFSFPIFSKRINFQNFQSKHFRIINREPWENIHCELCCIGNLTKSPNSNRLKQKEYTDRMSRFDYAQKGCLYIFRLVFFENADYCSDFSWTIELTLLRN